MELTDETIREFLPVMTDQCEIYQKPTMLGLASLERTCPLDNGRHDAQTYYLAQFGRLPIEIFHIILLDIDIKTLTILRRVGRSIRTSIDAPWQYKEIIKHVLNNLRAVHAGSQVSCRQLYDQLCWQECVACGRFGQYIYLLGFSRVRGVCMCEDKRFLAMKLSQARIAFGLDNFELARLPTLLSIPGRYSMSRTKVVARIILVGRTQAHTAGVRVHGSAEKMEDFVTKAESTKLAEYHEAKERADRTPGPNNSVRYPLALPEDVYEHNPYRFLCMARFPWLDRAEGKLEWGSNCGSCRNVCHKRSKGKLDERWLHARSGWVAHVHECCGRTGNIIAELTEDRELILKSARLRSPR